MKIGILKSGDYVCTNAMDNATVYRIGAISPDRIKVELITTGLSAVRSIGWYDVILLRWATPKQLGVNGINP